jgi:hypothetical protein
MTVRLVGRYNMTHCIHEQLNFEISNIDTLNIMNVQVS